MLRARRPPTDLSRLVHVFTKGFPECSVVNAIIERSGGVGALFFGRSDVEDNQLTAWAEAGFEFALPGRLRAVSCAECREDIMSQWIGPPPWKAEADPLDY